MSEMGSMASDSLELVPAVPNYRAFPHTTENTPAYHYARKAYACKSEDPTGQTSSPAPFSYQLSSISEPRAGTTRIGSKDSLFSRTSRN